MEPLIELIAKPSLQPKVLYMRHKKDTRSLQHQMGMQDCTEDFANILAEIRQSCDRYGVDRNVAYARQDPEVLKEVKSDALARIRILHQYEAGWPIDSYLKKGLKIHFYNEDTVERQYCVRRPHSNTRKRGKPGPHTTPRTPRCPRPNRAFVFISAPPPYQARGQATRSLSVLQEEIADPSTPSSSSSLVPASNGPTSDLDNHASTLTSLLTCAGLPHPDAVRIAGLFIGLGITDIAYLRLLARMYSRDGWLRELKEKGQLSEIQLRVLREMLERVAHEDEPMERK